MRQHKECLPGAGAQEECQTNIELAARRRPFYYRPRVNFCWDKFKWIVVSILTNLIGVVQLRYFWNGLLEHYVYTSEPGADILPPSTNFAHPPTKPQKTISHIYQWIQILPNSLYLRPNPDFYYQEKCYFRHKFTSVTCEEINPSRESTRSW